MTDNTDTCFATTLPNGLRVCYLPIQSEVAYCGLTIDAGSRDELPGQHGLAHFVEHTIFKGTRHRRAWHILNRMERVGGELNAFTTKENTTIYSIFPRPHLERATELIADLVAYSTFPQQEITREREVVLDEAASYRDSPAEAIYDDFEDLIWAGSTLGHNILGNEDDLRQFTGDDCRQYLNNLYVPSNMVFFIVGNYKQPSRLFNIVERHFGSLNHQLTKHQRVAPAILPAFDTTQQFGTHQSHTIYGAPVCNMHDENRYAMLLLNNLLGGPGMNSLLNIAIRERRGYAYTVESGVTLFSDCGLLQIYFGSDQCHVRRAIKVIGDIIDRLATKPLNERALEAAKKQFIGQLTVASDNHEAFALSAGKSFLYNGRHVTNQEVNTRINAVTAQQLMDAAASIHPTRASILTFK